MAVLIEMVNNTAADDAVHVSDNNRWFEIGIGYRVKVIGHDDVGIDGEACRVSRFIEGIAGYDFDGICTKDWKAVFGYGGEIESRCVS